MIQKIHRLGQQPRQPLQQIINFNRNSRQQSRLSPSFQVKGLKDNSRLRNYVITQPNSRQKKLYIPQRHQQQKRIISNQRNQQIVIINDRNIIKNRTLENLDNRILYQRHQSTHNKQQLDPWGKIKHLQNRITQLHQLNQTELIRLMNVNKRIELQLQNQRKKTNNLSNNKKISQEIETLIKIIITQKQIQEENILKQQKQPEFSLLQLKINKLSNQNIQYKQKTKSMEKQLSILRLQNQKKKDQLIEKKEQFQMLIENKKEMQIKMLRLTRQKQQLDEKLKRLQLQYNWLQQKFQKIQKEKRNFNKQTPYLIKDDNIIKEEKLKKISLRQSYLINQELDQPFLKINSSIRNKQNSLPDELSEDSLCNIIEKMELLTNTNDKIIIENQMLQNQIAKLVKDNHKLKNTLQLAYEQMHLKQLQIDAKMQQNNNLRRSIVSFQNLNQNTPKSRLDQKNFQLQLSTTTVNMKNQVNQCQRCRQLVKSLFSLRNKVMPKEKNQNKW